MTLPSTPPLLFEASRAIRLARGAIDICKDRKSLLKSTVDFIF